MKDHQIAELNLAQIIPDFFEANRNTYFRYQGSLTTPPCTEGIIWNVFTETILTSVNQVCLKRKL